MGKDFRRHSARMRKVWCDKKSRCLELLIGETENHLCRQMNLGELIKPL